MNSRIRYQNLNGLLVSSGVLTFQGQVYAEIDVTSGVYRIKNMPNSPEVYYFEGKGKSLHDLKKRVKIALTDMGAVFTKEVRKKRSVDSLIPQASE